MLVISGGCHEINTLVLVRGVAKMNSTGPGIPSVCVCVCVCVRVCASF